MYLMLSCHQLVSREKSDFKPTSLDHYYYYWLSSINEYSHTYTLMGICTHIATNEKSQKILSAYP